jgi:hypothetical protein
MRWLASSVANTGGLLLSIAPGMYFNPTRNLWLFARAQLPSFQHLNGEQKVDPSASLGLQYETL